MITATPDHKFRWIHEIIDAHFDLLLKRGFCIVSVMFTDQGMDDWQVMMLLDDCFVRLRCKRVMISLSLSTMQLLDQVGFLDLNILLQPVIKWDGFSKGYGTGWEGEEQQIEAIARLFGKYYNDIFLQLDLLSALIPDRLFLISKPDRNGRLSLDNRPFSISCQI